MPDVVNLMARVPKPLHERLRKEAFEQRRSLNQIVIEALDRWLAERDGAHDSANPERQP